MTEPAREELIAAIVRRPYHKLITGSPAEGFLAEVLELPGCITAGTTEEEALANLREAMEGWVESVLIAGEEVPEPLPEPVRLSA